MPKLKELREERNTLAIAVRDLVEKNPGASWNPTHQKAYEDHMASIERLDGEIARAQAVLDLDAETRFTDAVKDIGAERARGTKKDPLSPEGVYEAFLRYGPEGMSAEQRQVFRNTMSTTTPGQGGYTVPTLVVPNLIDELKYFGGMRQTADVFATTSGADMQYPTSDGTSEVGELVAQNAAAAAQDPSFNAVTLSVYRYSSKYVTVPLELLQDAVIDIEAFLRKRIAQRLGRIQNTHFTTGSGSSQPNGVVTAGTLGKTGITGQTLTVIFDDLVDLIHSVDYAYRALNNCRFMMNDASLKVIRKLKDGQSRPLFMPSYESGIGNSFPDTLLGYPIQINNDVAVMAANAKSILFGDFSFYKIRDAMEISVYRFTDSAFMKNGQVGFLAFMRSGGNLVDAKAVSYYANSAT